MSAGLLHSPSTVLAPEAIGADELWRGPVEVATRASDALVEFHVCARPQDLTGGFETQALSMYLHLLEALRACRATPADVVVERLFLSDAGEQAPRLAGLRSAFHAGRGRAPWPATSIVQQPPARPGQLCEMQAIALRSGAGAALRRHALEGTMDGGGGVIVEIGRLRHLFLSGMTGGPGVPGTTGRAAEGGLEFQREAAAMFRGAEETIRRAGLSFRDVVRTWIFVADIDRDYAALNRARREFLTSRGIQPPPASTGIQGVPFPPGRACALDLRAIGGPGLRAIPFGSPTMNEAPAYGADFSRGMRVEMEDRTVLYVSGTASIDAEGRVFAPGDIDAQVERMLCNVESLLSGQGAGWDDVVSQVTYLKEAIHAGAFLRAAARRGPPPGTPRTICVAGVCRPAWLCETEVTAVLGRRGGPPRP